MAITLIQSPNNDGNNTTGRFPHAKTGMQVSTFKSDKYSNYEDFMYYIEIENNKTGNKYSNLIPPLEDGGLSYYNLGQAVQNSVWYDYTPATKNIIKSENYIASYNVKYYEYYNSTIQIPSLVEKTYVVGNMILNVYNDGIDQINLLDYICNNDKGKFLTNVNKTLRLKKDDYASFKVLNVKEPIDIDTNIKYLMYDIYLNDGTIISGSKSNHYSAKDPTDVDNTSSVLELPIGPKNIDELFVTTIKLSNGYIFVVNDILTINTSNIDYYYVWTDSNTHTQSSQKYKIDVYCDKDDNLISWENSLGGTDYFNFSKRDKKVITTNQKTYEKNKYDWSGEYYNRVSKRGDTVYQNKYREVYTLYSPYLDTFELEYIEGLFYSENIEMLIDGKWYAGLNLKKKATIIQKGDTGMKQYKFEIEIDKNLILN